MAQKIIGIDLGSHTVKAVLLEGSFRGFAVRRYLTVPMPQDAPAEAPADDPADADAPETPAARPFGDRLAEALAALREQDPALKADAVYTAVPGGAVTTHLITLPFTDARKIEQTLPFELEDQLPFDLDDVVWDTQILDQRDGKSQALVGVVKKEVLGAVVESLGQAGLDPRVVSLSSLAYQNLFAHGVVTPLEAETAEDGSPAAARGEAVLDIGHQSTDLLIVEGGAARFARSFPVAGRALTLAVAAATRTSPEEAEALKITEASLRPAAAAADPRIAEALVRGLTPLVRGVRQSFMAYAAKARTKVERVHLTGGTARLPGLAEWLASELGCEVVALDPFPEAQTGDEVPQVHTDDPAAGLAMALALRAQGGVRTARVNLRKGPYAFKGDLSYLKGNVSRLAALAAVILVLLGANVFARFQSLAVHEEKIDQAMCELTQKVLGQCLTNPDDALSRLKGTRKTAAAIPRVSAAEVLAEITNRLQGVDEIELSELDITGPKVRLQGTAGSFDSVAKVVEALKGYSCFGQVSQGQTRQARSGDKIEFNVDADMKAECAS